MLFSGSPFRVPVKDVVDVSKVKCSGPGLANKVSAHLPQMFSVDCTKAGLAPLEVQLYGPTGDLTQSSTKMISINLTCYIKSFF